jgi:hypothetical protein
MASKIATSPTRPRARRSSKQHSMPQLWHDAIWSFGIATAFAALTENRIMLGLALALVGATVIWYEISHQCWQIATARRNAAAAAKRARTRSRTKRTNP